MTSISNSVREQREKFPKIDGVQYKSVVKTFSKERLDYCTGCAAQNGGRIDTALCNKLPSCNRWERLDGENVVFQEVGKVAAK